MQLAVPVVVQHQEEGARLPFAAHGGKSQAVGAVLGQHRLACGQVFAFSRHAGQAQLQRRRGWRMVCCLGLQCELQQVGAALDGCDFQHGVGALCHTRGA